MTNARLEPLHHRRTRIKLLLNSYLDAIQPQTTQTETHEKPGSRLLLPNPQLWPYGSYHRLQTALDELRGFKHGVYNCTWSVYVCGSGRHMNRRAPKANLGLDWLTQQLTEPVYVPVEISENAGYLRSEAMAYATSREKAAA